MPIARDFSLDAKYRQEEGVVFLSGIQALVRLPLDQHRADRRRGLNTATMISGYRGSPLGGLDLTLERNRPMLAEHNVVFVSGVNEDLGATVVYGSQLANYFPQPKYDGVLGMWYGKGPGVDRTGDIFKHANFAGIGKNGGVLALGGDDPLSKSSTLPTHSEVAFYDAQFPVLFPGSVQEILDMGRLGFELSRYSGLWVGFKIVTNVADEIGTADVAPGRVSLVDPRFEWEGRPWRHTQNPTLLPPFGLEMEREIHYGRLEAAKVFAAANGLNRVALDPNEAWLGLVAAGKTYYDLREALRELGLDEAALRHHGIRILKIGMMYPMEPSIVRHFARGLEEILVVEEKRSFIEMFLRDVLYNDAVHPRIVGKRDEQGRPLVPANGELDADRIAQIVASRLERKLQIASITARVALLETLRERPAGLTLARPAYFCSGCPHNRSTVVPEGSMAAAGIGCHGMALNIPERRTMGLTHMGGEGAQWVGMAPFTKMPHMFQNLGDGTFFHSGSLAVRQAVAAGTNVTYKLLYNSAVAMTGGQDAAGATPVPELTRILEAEGAKRVIVMTDEPDKYGPDVRWAQGVEVWHRDRLDEAQKLLRDIPGVTVLVYDQRCAAEKRRLRKRDRLPDPAMRVVINEAVCEGCGDCGVKSNCSQRAPGRDRVRAQDPDPPVVLQQGLLVPARRLPVVPDHHSARLDQEEGAQDVHGGPRAARACAEGAAQRQHLHDGHRRHRRGDRQPGAGHRRAARRQDRARSRSDRAQPEGRTGRLAPQDLRAGRGSLEQGGRRIRRLLPGLRRAGGDRAPESRSRAGRPHDRRRVDQSGADRRHGHAHRRAVPRRRRAAELDQSGDPQGRERVLRRARPRRDAVRRPHGDQHARAGRRLSGRRHPGQRRGHRGSHQAQRRVGGDEHARLPGGPAARGRSELAGARSSGTAWARPPRRRAC